MQGVKRLISAVARRGEGALMFGLHGGFVTAAIAFSIGAVAWPIFNLDAVEALADNSLHGRDRVTLALTSAGVCGAFLALFAGLIRWGRRTGTTAQETVRRINEALLWTLGLPLLVFLSVDDVAATRPVFTVCVIITVTLLVGASFYRLLAHLQVKLPRAYSEPKVKHGVAVLVAVMMVVFTAWIAQSAIHQEMSRPGADATAALDRILSGDIRGGLWSTDGLSRCFEPILLLLAPLSALIPGPEALIVVQTSALALGAVPIYLLANDALDSRRAGGAFAAAYLLLPGLHGAALAGFDPLVLLGPLFLTLVWCLERRAWRGFYLLVALCLMVRDDAAFFMAGVGLSMVVSLPGEARKHGWFTMACATAYGLVVCAAAPDLGPTECGAGGPCPPGPFAALSSQGIGSTDLLLSVWSNPGYALSLGVDPQKLLYLTHLLLPVLFLPLVAHRGKLMLGFGLILCVLGSNPLLFGLSSAHSTWLYPVVIALSPLALAQLRRGDRPWLRLDRTRVVATALAMIMVAGVLNSWKFGAFAHKGGVDQAAAVKTPIMLVDDTVDAVGAGAPAKGDAPR